MVSKLRIRVGNAEIEYEGVAEFSQLDLKDLIAHMGAIPTSGGIEQPPPSNGNGAASYNAQGLHTDTIAARIQAKTSGDLAIAAAAHLQMEGNKSSFSRNDLLTAMKSATHYYKEAMGKNLTVTLGRLVTSKALNKIGSDSFSLSNEKIAELETAIAQQ